MSIKKAALISVVSYALIAGVIFTYSLKLTGESLTYPLDDTYIHLAISQNLASGGGWGLEPGRFASLSSSMLWTLILTLIHLALGVHVLTPLILNFAFGLGLMALTVRVFDRYDVPPRGVMVGALAVMLFTPLFPLVFTGLEHVLQALLVLILAERAARLIAGDRARRDPVLPALAALAVMARFESLFLVLAIAILLLARRRWRDALSTVGSGFLPIAVFGAIQLRNGWYFLPNSVLLKGRTPDISSLTGIIEWLFQPWITVYRHPHFLLLFLAVLASGVFLIRRERSPWRPLAVLHILFLLTATAHIQLARFGWFYRYEAYLMLLGLVLLTLAAPRHLSRLKAAPGGRRPGGILFAGIGPAALVMVGLLGGRGVKATLEIPRAGKNIHDQQIQMARFLGAHYSGEPVAANDIGAINYFTEVRCLDLWGLSDMAVARAKRAGEYDTAAISRLTADAGITIAVIYEHWLDPYGGVPEDWIKVATWRISDNVICGWDTVTFFAVDEEQRRRLVRSLEAFTPYLPDDVRQDFIHPDLYRRQLEYRKKIRKAAAAGTGKR